MSLTSLYDAASLWMTPSGRKEGKVYSEKPVPVYGAELVTNGDFATDSDWALTQATISNGKLLLSTSNGSYTAASQTLGVIGKTYKVSLDVADIVGTVSVTIGGGTDFDITSNGIHSFEITSTTTTLEVKRKFGVTNVSATIDNVSVKEVLASDGDFTFTRGSNLSATRVDASQLIEKGRENVITYSNDFSNATWAKSNLSVASSNGAWEVTDNTSSGSHYIFWIGTTPVSSVVTLSIEAKAGAEDYLAMRLGGFTYAFFNISNGTLGSVNGAFIDAKIEATSNGFYKCSATINTPSSGNATAFYPSDNSSSVSYTGTGAVAITIKNAQLELGLVATPYIETGATTAQAGILEDTPRFDYSGGAACPSLLLEPSRSNLFIQSEFFYPSSWSKTNVSVTSNAATSPQGVSNATEITENSSTAQHFIGYSLSLTSGTSYSVSVYAKKNTRSVLQISPSASHIVASYANYDLENGVVSASGGSVTTSIEDAGDGWYRCVLTFTATSTATASIAFFMQSSTTASRGAAYAGNGTSGVYIYGAQFEVGSYPTSYIPTYGVSQTRAKEQCNVNNVSGEIGQTQGTIFLDADLYKKSNTEFYIAVSDGTLSNSIYLHQSSQSLSVNKRISGVTEFLQVTSANWSSGRNKCAITYTATEMKIFVNGVLKDTETINGLPSELSKLTLGSRQDNLGELASDADYKQALVFPTALTDSECVELTINGLKEELIAAYKTRVTTLEEGASERLDTYLQSLEDFIII